MSSNESKGEESPSQAPRGRYRGGSASGRGRGRGNSSGGAQRGPDIDQPPPPYEDIVIPIVSSPPTSPEPNGQLVQNVTHVHVTIGGGSRPPRGRGGGQRGGAPRGNFAAQRGGSRPQGASGAGGEKSNRGGAQSSQGYQRGRGGTSRGAPSGQYRGGCNNLVQPSTAPPPPPPSRQEFSNPLVPFYATIIGGFTSSTRRLTLIGTPSAKPRQFSVNLKNNAEFLFHFNPRFFNSTVVRNTTRGGNWQKEETTASSFPFVPNQTFSLILTAAGPVYNVSVNGQHFTAFAARDDQQLVNMVTVEGDIILQTVIVE